MELLSIIAMVVLVLLIIVLLFYTFCGPISFIFYFLGLVGKILWFPITLIQQVIYPVGPLPKIVLSGFILYFFVILFVKTVKFFISLKSK